MVTVVAVMNRAKWRGKGGPRDRMAASGAAPGERKPCEGDTSVPFTALGALERKCLALWVGVPWQSLRHTSTAR